MVYKHFTFRVVLRILLLVANLVLLVVMAQHGRYLLSSIFLGILAVLQVWDLIAFVLKSQQNLTRLLQAIQYEDFNQGLPLIAESETFRRFRDVCEGIMQRFREMRLEKERQYIFLQNLVEHIPVGIICCTQNGDVQILNAAASRMLPLSYVHHLESLNRVQQGLGSKLLALKPGEKLLLKLTREDAYMQISVQAVLFKLGNEEEKLLILSPIGREMEGKELEAWQKLTRVLSHEIMNSITPIISLSGTALGLMQQVTSALPAAAGTNEQERMEDISSALETIEKRSRHLLQFVEAYRKLNKVPPPEFEECDLEELVQEVISLMDKELKEKNIEVQFKKPNFPTRLLADQALMEQVFINIIKNSMDVLEKIPQPKLQISFRALANKDIEIKIKDNGPGLHPDITDKIFIPFFSTKKTGSGIGLSLCRQILWAHGGTMYLENAEGGGAEARVLIPAH